VFCPHCGAPTNDEARFCATCGRGLRVPGADAGAGAPGDATILPSGSSHRSRAVTARGEEAVTRPPSHSDRKPGSSSGGWLSSSDSINHGRFAPGAVLDGRFRIIGLLGKGGMGEVYRADDLRLGQPVALKFLPDAIGADPVRLAQFHNEVRTARQISHPNICRVYDIGEIDSHLYLSMEYVDGEDLAASLRRIGRFPEDKATDIARQLCAGLAAAHERGVLHRDLKPANVMLDDAGKVRLMDFGLAAIGAVEDIRAGTPAYMAPEQLLGREVTARSDIYALGLVLYELFTGRRAFTAATLNELVEQHQSGQITPPHTIVTSLDLAIERAIMRCLDPNPSKRPATALGVSAALPGGDPLAAALAAGETPSPEMVAAAGEGAGLSRRVAIPVFAIAIVGILGTFAMALPTNPLERLRPELTEEVLAQRARDAIRQLGYIDRPQDEDYGFFWDEALTDHQREQGAKYSDDTLTKRPSPLLFGYRRSQSALLGFQFHDDLLTPGIVTGDDPAPIESGMIAMTLDHRGQLVMFEAIPPQVEDTPGPARPLDWTPLLTLAGLDPAALQPTAPQWNWLAASDARAAWNGTWPGGTEPLRVEAAALRGTPVAFQLVGPWTNRWRTAGPVSGGETAFLIIVFGLVFAIIGGGSVLARKNLREGRGDRRGAQALGSAVAGLLWALWLFRVHPTQSIGLFGIFLICVATTVFYAALFWSMYLALEPFVRRYWPQTLVSWTTVLSGRFRDPIVGRDVLFGVLLGVVIALLVRSTEIWQESIVWVPTSLLGGTRSTAGEIVYRMLNGARTAMVVFFLLFLFRALLRNQWAAAILFVGIFAGLNLLTSSRPIFDTLTNAIYFSMFAVAVMRWGLTTLTSGIFVADLLLAVPATTNLGAFYAVGALIFIGVPLAIACWAFYTSLSGKVFAGDLVA
jgi:hypothetical protein